MQEQDMVPVTILTGFLGSGKTTLLNRILKEDHGQRIAVIENEFGEVGVDNEIIESGDEQIVEMNNGCICCTVRGDLIRILGTLKEKRDQGDAQVRPRGDRDHRHGRPRAGGADLLHRRGDRQLLPARLDHHRWSTRSTRRSSSTSSTRRRSRSASPTGSCCRRPTWFRKTKRRNSRRSA